MRLPHFQRHFAFSLPELMAALAVIAVVAILVVPRVSTHRTAGDAAACHANKAEIEIQTRLWKRVNGSWPAANLSSIGSDLGYFPEGLPVCPVDGSSYTIDTSTGLVVGHEH